MTSSPTLTLADAHTALATLTAAFTDTELQGATRAEFLTFTAAAEHAIRVLQSAQYSAIAELETILDDTLGLQRVPDAMADALRITPREARARVATAERVTDRVSITGEPLAPVWENSGKLIRAGIIGTAHVDVIKRFFRHLPHKTDPATVAFCEAQLADYARDFRPDEMDKLAAALLAAADPDGTLTDEKDRANARFFLLGRQTPDKMVTGRFRLDPSTAAALEAWFAKFAAPGMCNPADTNPTITGDAPAAAVTKDDRSYGQRCHDALAMLVRNGLTDEAIGRHRGLPASIIITADIKDLDPNLQRTAGRTGGNLAVPISDVLAIGRHARHYLAIFDHGTPLALIHGRDQRLASAGQRLMLHASEGGCTFPSCPRGGYYTQVHHVNDWILGGNTDIHDETLACDIHHRLVGPGKWETRKRDDGVTLWIPPASLDPTRKPRINLYHRRNHLGWT